MIVWIRAPPSASWVPTVSADGGHAADVDEPGGGARLMEGGAEKHLCGEQFAVADEHVIDMSADDGVVTGDRLLGAGQVDHTLEGVGGLGMQGMSRSAWLFPTGIRSLGWPSA